MQDLLPRHFRHQSVDQPGFGQDGQHEPIDTNYTGFHRGTDIDLAPSQPHECGPKNGSCEAR